MEDIVRGIVEAAPAFSLGLVWVAAARILVVQGFYMLVLPFMLSQQERTKRARARIDALGDSDDAEAVMRIWEEEGDSPRGCLAWLAFVLVVLGFAIVSFIAVWRFVADAAPPSLAATAGWIGVLAAVVEAGLAGVYSWFRSGKDVEAVVTVGLVLVLAVLFAIVYALAPTGVVLYAMAVFGLNQLIRLLWHIFYKGRVHVLIGLL